MNLLFTKKETSNYKPIRLIVDYVYPHEEIKVHGEQPVRFLFAPVEDFETPYVLFVIAQSVISPMNYPVETWELINDFLISQKVSADEVTIYLDYEEQFGEKRGKLSLWKFRSDNGGFIEDKLLDVEPEQLAPSVKKVRDDYYKDFSYHRK